MSRVEYLPFAQPGAYEPEELGIFYRRLREREAVSFYDKRIGYEVVHSYTDVAYILKGHDVQTDRATVAIDNSNALDPYVSKAQLASNPACWPGVANLVRHTKPATANATGPDHENVKKAVYDSDSLASLNRSYTERNHGAYVERMADELAGGLKQRFETENVVDLSEAFVRPYVARIIAKVVGFDAQHHETIKQWSDAQTALLGQDLPWSERPRATSALGDLARACHALATNRRMGPKKDITSLMVGPRHHLDDVLAGSAAMNLIAAGYATTYGTLLNSMRYLSTSAGREHWAQLRDPKYDKLLVPELTRLETGLVGWRRQAANEVPLSDGSSIPAGRKILLLIGAANRDAVFAEPDTLDVTRSRKPQQLSFGIGSHLCMGRELATLEMGVALRALRRSFPGMRVLPEASITYDADMLFRTPQHLPVVAR